VDSIVNNSKGFAWPRRLIVGHGPSGHDSGSVCPFDYEGSWAIGLVKGKSAASPVDGDMWQTLIDSSIKPAVSCATLVTADGTGKGKGKGKDKGKGTKETATSPASFVADPFMFRKSQEEWYLFFEYKDVVKYKGEIGVAISRDEGQTFEFLGTALSDPHIHLSYPHVLQKRSDDNVFQMIPETKKASQVRIYETNKHQFPFGWKLVATPLQGPYLDTSTVWHDNRHFIFTTTSGITGRSLHLFTTNDLTDQPWIPHPSNPIVKSSRLYGRSGGRPIVYRGHIYRFAQDNTRFYGEAVHILRVHVVTSTRYDEQHVATVRPNNHAKWTRARLHHMDVHVEEYDQTDGDGVVSERWMAFFDADSRTDYDEFFDREGWLYYLKKFGLVSLLFWVGRDLVRIARHYQSMKDAFRTCCKKNEYALSTTATNTNADIDTDIMENAKVHDNREISAPIRLLFLQHTKKIIRTFPPWKLVLYFVVSILLSVIIIVFTTNIKHLCVESNSHPTAVCFAGAKDFTEDPKLSRALHHHHTTQHDNTTAQHHPTRNTPLLIVTAASTSFMIRLRNLVGSIHFWEPHVHTVVYDLGFSPTDLQEIATWKRCTVVTFPFGENPPHVKLLYNFAWKIVLFRHALDRYGRFMYLDAGLEVLRPLEGVRYYLETDGYFSSIITNYVGKETHPSLYAKLDVILKRMAETEGRDFRPMDVEAVKNARFCAGGIQGFVEGSRAESLILKPALECALDEHCIAPPGSGRNNHNYDQSVLASLAHATGLGDACHEREVYCSPMTIDYTIDESRCNGLEIAGRRWRGPRRYPPHIDLYFDRASTPNIAQGIGTIGNDGYQKTALGTVEVLTGKKPQANSKWQKCQDRCANTFHERERNNGAEEDLTLKKAWEKCLEKCPSDTQKQFWDSDRIDVVVIEYFSYWLKGIMFGCVNYRLHTIIISLCVFLSLLLYESAILHFLVRRCCCCLRRKHPKAIK